MKIAALVFACALALLGGCSDKIDRPDSEATGRDRAGGFTDVDEQLMVEIYNQSGCDPPMNANTCTPRGSCCDVHDDCIDQHCPSPFGDLTQCLWAGNNCPPACRACHDAVIACFTRCGANPPPADCRPALCCGPPNTCGQEQACYDRTRNPPVLITDPCECEQRGLPLSPSPPRPANHCCAGTGTGGQGGIGQPPLPGGVCCGILWEEDGECIFRCNGGPILRDAPALEQAVEVCGLKGPGTAGR